MTASNLNEQMQAWVNKKASGYCPDCPKTCCDGVRHIIEVGESKLELFAERGIPIIRTEDLNRDTYQEWKQTQNIPQTLYTKDGKVVPKPSLIETPPTNGESTFRLYVERYCPLYDEAKGCEVHEDPRRPSVCKQYPLLDLEDGNFTIIPSCTSFDQRSVREDFQKTFPTAIMNPESKTYRLELMLATNRLQKKLAKEK